MARMRTPNGLCEHYRSIDPDSAITTTFIRQALKTNAVPYCKSGKKFLIAIEEFDKYLEQGLNSESHSVEKPKIRRLAI